MLLLFIHTMSSATRRPTKRIKTDPDLLLSPESYSLSNLEHDILDILLDDMVNSSTTSSTTSVVKVHQQQKEKIDFTQNDDLFFIILSNVVVSETITKLLGVFNKIENGREIPQNQEAALSEEMERKKGFYINPNRWNLNWKDYKELKNISYLIGTFAQLNKKSAKNVLSIQACSTQETDPREHWIMLYKTSYVVAKLYTIVQEYNYKHILPTVRYYSMEYAKGDKIYRDSDTKTYHVDIEAFKVLLEQAKEKMSKTPERYNKFVTCIETLQDYYSNLLMWKNHFFVYLVKYYNSQSL